MAAIEQRLKLSLVGKKGGWLWKINSSIPQKVGLGSSAALAVAQAAALVCLRSKNPGCSQGNTPGVVFSRYLGVINEIAFLLEKITHGNPSGVDNTVCSFGGMFLFRKGRKLKSLKIKKLPEFLLVNTGQAEETTKKMVELVSEKRKAKSEKVQRKTKSLLEFIGELPEQFVEVFEREDFSQLKCLIKENERLLESLGVVGKRAKKVVHLIEDLGGAAKICGAGGIKKGSGMALVYHENLCRIEEFCKREKLEFFRVKLGGEGARIEFSSVQGQSL